MTRRDDDAGFTLVELLIAMSLSLVILTATLAVFARMERGTRDNQQLNDAHAQVRVATDALARRLRNLASPDENSQQPLERATSQDLIFRTVSATGSATDTNPENVERNRFCLRASDGALLMQRQTGDQVVSAPPPADTACPGTGWEIPAGQTTDFRVAAQHVTNGSRPVFLYEVSPTPGTYTEASSVSDPELFSAIGLRVRLHVDPDTRHLPKESTVTTRVFLRNQNRPPTPAFDVTATGLTLLLNASGSDDPESQALTYQWLDGGAPLVDRNGVEVGTTTSAVTSFAAAPGRTYELTLKVTDIGDLPTTSAPPVSVTCTVATVDTPAHCLAP